MHTDKNTRRHTVQISLKMAFVSVVPLHAFPLQTSHSAGTYSTKPQDLTWQTGFPSFSRISVCYSQGLHVSLSSESNCVTMEMSPSTTNTSQVESSFGKLNDARVFCILLFFFFKQCWQSDKIRRDKMYIIDPRIGKLSMSITVEVMCYWAPHSACKVSWPLCNFIFSFVVKRLVEVGRKFHSAYERGRNCDNPSDTPPILHIENKKQTFFSLCLLLCLSFGSAEQFPITKESANPHQVETKKEDSTFCHWYSSPSSTRLSLIVPQSSLLDYWLHARRLSPKSVCVQCKTVFWPQFLFWLFPLCNIFFCLSSGKLG